MAWLAGKAKEYQKQLVLGLLVVLVVVMAIIWAVASRQSTSLAAQEALAAATVSVRSAVAAKEEDRAAAVKEAVAQCEQVAAMYSATHMAPQALLQAAQLLMETGQSVEAAGLFKRVVALTGDLPGLRELARRGLAEALEDGGDAQAAVAVYQEINAQRSGAERAQSSWDLGRCYETLKDAEKAKSYYQQAVEYGPNTTWAQLAESRLDALANPPAAAVAPAPEKPTAPTPEEKPAASGNSTASEE